VIDSIGPAVAELARKPAEYERLRVAAIELIGWRSTISQF